MSYLADHWTLDPFLVVVAILVAGHEIGLARLARRSGGNSGRPGRRRSLAFYAGLATLLLSVCSPLDYWSYRYFFVHMVQHLLLMFAAPSLVVAGAPWLPLLAALPGRAGRGDTGAGPRGGLGRPLRVLGGLVFRPWASVILFSAVMVGWHLPPLLDFAQQRSWAHLWLMDGSFFLAGVLFWLQIIPSPPFGRRMPLVQQAAALFVTNVVMWILAMSMSIFSQGSWYSVYQHVPGVSLPPFADQEIGAAILWVCGDFWAIPALIYVVRQIVNEDGGVGGAIEQILHRGAAGSGWAAGRGVRLGSSPAVAPQAGWSRGAAPRAAPSRAVPLRPAAPEAESPRPAPPPSSEI